MMDAELCDTTFTGQKLEKYLLSALSNDHNGYNGNKTPLDSLRLVEVDAKPLGIQGFLSKVLQIRLNWNEKDKAKLASAPDSVIVKCATAVKLQRLFDTTYGSEESVDASIRVRSVHNDECTAYRFLTDRKNGYQHSDTPIPRFFGAHMIGETDPCSDGVLILEDLSHCGKVMKTIGQKLNPAQIECLTVTLAHLHAWSYMKLNTENGHSEFKIPYVADRLEIWESWFCITPEVYRLTVNQFPEMFAHVPEQKLLDFLSLDSYLSIFGKDAHKGILPTVLVHGDIQSMNILWSTRPDDENRLIALIDWQLTHKGYGAEDLARLLTVCSTTDFKLKRTDDILRLYMNAFNEKIKGSGLEPLNFENLKSVFSRAHALMALTFAMSVRCVDQFTEAVEDEEERKLQKQNYINNCRELLSDAMATLGW